VTGAFTALTTLASPARQTNRPVNLREEADGMIYCRSPEVDLVVKLAGASVIGALRRSDTQ